jgi:photosystem II stability/assembly factor-like uncharacterized protein
MVRNAVLTGLRAFAVEKYLMRFRPFFVSASLLLCLLTVPALHAATHPWPAVGPDGGDARSLAADPADSSHLYLGTANSWIYQSMDDGAHWTRLAQLGTGEDLVIDHIIVDERDPHTLYAGAWRLDRFGGGVFVSHDSGATWSELTGMHGQSVRALAQAPSDSHILVAGTISGVYRTEDGGQHWKEISPAGSGEIREVQSIAIDPTDPDTIYAGTWHLPWKTNDGGRHWFNIKKGIITDSDVFSILIDPQLPTVLYASACSGIYRSDNGGLLFRKVQGIPTTARRTRSIKEDPQNRNVVYAGTTEGLYKTVNGGKSWNRLTSPFVVINDILINPSNPQRVLMATDQNGVLASNNGGKSFLPSNSGFSERVVSSVLVDHQHPGTLYAGVVNGKSFGGVFVSHDNGRTWAQQSNGLGGRDVFALAQSSNGTVYAGTNDGLYRWSPSGWVQDGNILNSSAHAVPSRRHAGYRHDTRAHIDTRVDHLFTSGPVWYAATVGGVYSSRNQGVTWQGPILHQDGYIYFGRLGSRTLAVNRTSIRYSRDHGQSWRTMYRPLGLSYLTAATVTPGGTLWVGGPQGIYFTHDAGLRWFQLKRLPVNAINSLAWDPAQNSVLLSSSDSTVVYAINPKTYTWKWWNTGWLVHAVHPLGRRLVAVSDSNGVVVQPAAQSATALAEAGGN